MPGYGGYLAVCVRAWWPWVTRGESSQLVWLELVGVKATLCELLLLAAGAPRRLPGGTDDVVDSSVLACPFACVLCAATVTGVSFLPNNLGSEKPEICPGAAQVLPRLLVWIQVLFPPPHSPPKPSSLASPLPWCTPATPSAPAVCT